MACPKQEPKLQRRQVKDLRPYPRQADFFHDIPKRDLLSIVQGLKQGIVHPIEVLPKNRAGLPPNTILRGHQRLRAYKLIGAVEIDVLVRYDLADADENTIEREFLVDNVYRRHLDKLGLARVTLRLIQLRRAHPERRLQGAEEEEARDEIGKVIGMSGRNLQRYWNVLRSPREIQEAFRAGQLTLVQAARVAGLSTAEQSEIADAIRAGATPRQAVATLPAPRTTKQESVNNVFNRLTRELERDLQALDGQIARLDPSRLSPSVPLLKKGRMLLRKLIEQAQQADEQAG
jgi:ParB-like chromosome segregation protein Spo0J